MRQGGGKAKGNNYEREICSKLSIWVSRGARSDLFARNVASGGVFTTRTKKGHDTLTPGDLMAGHPLANEFLATFSVECKSYRDLGLDAFIFEALPKSFIGKVLAKCEKEGKDAGGRHFLLIAKQNLRHSLVIAYREVGEALLYAAMPFDQRIRYHWMHQRSVFVAPLQDILDYSSARDVLRLLKKA